jgi:hypothetical protein
MTKQIFSTGADTYEVEVKEEPVAEPAVQQPIEIKLVTGEVIKAATYEEALKVAVKMQEDTHKTLREEKEARERLEASQASLASEVAKLRQPPQTNGNGFDKNRYWELMNTDPVMAQNYVDAYRFGIDTPEQVPGYFKQIATDVSNTRQEALAAAFLQQHQEDFPPTGAAALRKQFETLITSGYPATLDTLNMAYGHAVDAGTIKPLEKQQQQQRDEPNPSLRGEGNRAVTEDEASQAEKMDDKALESFLRSKGMI